MALLISGGRVLAGHLEIADVRVRDGVIAPTDAPLPGNALQLDATGLLVLATLVPTIRSGVWWIRGFDFPRLQLTVLSAPPRCMMTPSAATRLRKSGMANIAHPTSRQSTLTTVGMGTKSASITSANATASQTSRCIPS